jgi:hypothetical protein
MNGSGSAPITMAPGWSHGVQQTTLDLGVFRGMTVMPPLYDWPPYARCCLFRCWASADEARSMASPKTETTNPTESDVMLTFAKRMASSHRFPVRASANVARPAVCRIAHCRLYMRLAAVSARVQPARLPRASSRLSVPCPRGDRGPGVRANLRKYAKITQSLVIS